MSYLETNKKLWNHRTETHYNSEFYDIKSFIKGKSSLHETELQFLKDIKGKEVLHLQCHFGMDSISLARMGAKVTAMDLSPKAIEKANSLAQICKEDVEFICCDLYDLPNHLDRKFDYIFTSYGVVGWLPDLDAWAKIISNFLSPKSKFLLVEFHPVIWMFDDQFSNIQYKYDSMQAIEETENGSYTENSKDLSNDFVMWNHGLETVMMSLIENKIQIDSFKEYDFSHYNCFDKTVKIKENQYQIEHLKGLIPMMYSIFGTRRD